MATTFDDEVFEKLGRRPQPKPGGKNIQAVLEWDRRYRELFPQGPIYSPKKALTP